ncbi:hypothetical protein ABZV34_18800 [Streptomyces sp. NPDC005195]|uniref:hypothetical protein n=1 Tax=Streptomyces sp. NPDC005195 TaxID=3154561 RepID=UPI0033A9A404
MRAAEARAAEARSTMEGETRPRFRGRCTARGDPLGLPAPLGVFLVGGERARSTLGGWKDRAARHNVAVMAVLFSVMGLKLLGDGIAVRTA